MKTRLFLVVLMLISFHQNYACRCICLHDNFFGATAYRSNVAMLVKVLSYDHYLEDAIFGYKGKMPASMTVEVIKKYKGKDSRSRIRIWGDDGGSCRRYIGSFKLGQYYLITPIRLGRAASKKERSRDYTISGCCEDVLFVEYDKKKAIGNYGPDQKKVTLSTFEKELKTGKFELNAKANTVEGIIRQEKSEKVRQEKQAAQSAYSLFQQIGILALILIGCIAGIVILSRLKK